MRAFLLSILVILRGETGLAQLRPYQPPYSGFDSIQDRQGYVWIATPDGLVRLDAHQARRFSTADGLPHLNVTSVAETTDGTLWAGTTSGLARYTNGRFEKVTSEIVKSMAALPNNRLWVASTRLKILHKGTPIPVADIFDPTQPAVDTARNRVWFGSRFASLCSLQLDNLSAVPRCRPGEPISGIALDSNGSLVQRSDHSLFRFDPNTGSRQKLRQSQEWLAASAIKRDATGRVWLPGFTQTTMWDGHKFETFPTPNPALSFLLDRDSTMWIGGRRYARFGHAQQFSLPGVLSVLRHTSGTLYAGAFDGSVHQLEPNSPVFRQVLPPGRVAPPIISMTAAPGGGLWLSQRVPTLVHLDAAGSFQPQITDPQHACYRLVTTPDGALWCGGNKGLLRITRPPYFEVIPLPDSGKSVRGLAVTPSGAVVAGHYGGVSIFRDGKLHKHWSRGRDLLDDRIQCLGADDRQIWFGYDDLQAFTRIRYDKDPPEIQHFNSDSGHQGAGSVFFQIDRKGRIWRGGTDAIYVSDGRAVAPDDWVRLGEAESWPFDGTAQNSVFEDTDGSLWFGTDKGLLHYTPPPDLFDQLRTPTTIALTAVAFDKQPAAIVELAPTKLQGGGHSVQLHFSALHYASPKEHRYRYRLFPREKEWIATDQFQVTYPDLPSGDYRFEVHGRAENRAWSNTPATFAFTLQAPFYATTWFLGSAGTLSLTGLVLLLRRYQHRRARRQREQRIKQLFLKALDLSPEARAALIDAAPDVATELRSMLENTTQHDPAGESRVLPIGEVFEHRYDIDRWVGSGGFSHVYLARDRKLSGRPTAIKVHQSRHAAQPELIAQIKREVATLSKLDHPHIVDIYDTGLTPDGRLFLAMEYIDGPSLRQLDLPLEPARVAKLMQQLADAVDAAHQAGIVHRDLKPGNLILRNAGTPQEHLMVIDFGLATQTGAATQQLLAATPDYMAPEQHQGRAYPATDVYAMALIAFELLTGMRYATIVREGGSMPDPIAAVLEPALAQDPTARPSPQQFAAQLLEAIG